MCAEEGKKGDPIMLFFQLHTRFLFWVVSWTRNRLVSLERGWFQTNYSRHRVFIVLRDAKILGEMLPCSRSLIKLTWHQITFGGNFCLFTKLHTFDKFLLPRCQDLLRVRATKDKHMSLSFVEWKSCFGGAVNRHQNFMLQIQDKENEWNWL